MKYLSVCDDTEMKYLSVCDDTEMKYLSVCDDTEMKYLCGAFSSILCSAPGRIEELQRLQWLTEMNEFLVFATEGEKREEQVRSITASWLTRCLSLSLSFSLFTFEFALV